jgi:hypothetical protein
MAIVLYLFVLLIAAGSVLFGLDLATSPLPSGPNVPIGRSVRHVASAPASPDKIVHQETAADRKRADDRELTPIYPASPGPSAPIVTAKVPTAPAASEDQPVDRTAIADDSQPLHQDEKEEDGMSASAQAQQQASCDVEACSAAYRSFTPTDCSYQPLRGPRRLCTKSDSAHIADAPAEAPVNQASGRAARTYRPNVRWIVREAPQRRGLFTQHSPDMSDTARIVRQLTRGYPMGDIAVQRADGSIIIVHTGETRAQAYR